MIRTGNTALRVLRITLILALIISLVIGVPWTTFPKDRAYAETKISHFKEVSVADHHMAIITTDDDLYTYGNNTYGKLGHGVSGESTHIKKILGNVESVSASTFNTVAVTKDHNLWFCGANFLWDDVEDHLDGDEFEYGQWGMVNILKPVKVANRVKSVSAAMQVMAYIDEDDVLWIWGTDDSCLVTGTGPQKAMEDVKSVSITEYGDCIGVVKKDGSLWVWGNNEKGDLGLAGGEQESPVKLMDGVSMVSMGFGLSGALKTDGSLYTWGEDDSTGALPTKRMSDVKYISFQYGAAGAVKTDGSLYTWGNNVYAGLGDGTMEDRTDPVEILDGIEKVSMHLSSMALTDDGEAYWWGNIHFQSVYGNGEADRVLTPMPLVINVSDSGDEPDTTEFVFPDDAFSFDQKECGSYGGYYMTEDDYDRLISDLPYYLIKQIKSREKMMKEEFDGSCFGFSTVALLLNEGILSLSDVSKETVKNTNDVKRTKKAFSVVNYYQTQMDFPSISNVTANFMKLSVPQKFQKIEAEIEQYGSALLLFNGVEYEPDGAGWPELHYSPHPYGHAVVVYGIEEDSTGWNKTYTDSLGNKKQTNYKKRLLIYDCNDADAIVYLYYNADGEWFLPGSVNDEGKPRYNIYNDARDRTTKKFWVADKPELLYSGLLCAVEGNAENLNMVDFHTGEYDPFNQDYRYLYTINTSLVIGGEDGEISATLDPLDVEYAEAVPDEEIIPLGPTCTGMKDGTQVYNYILPAGESKYTIRSDSENLKAGISGSDSSTLVMADSAGTATIRDDGTASATFDQKCDYVLDVSGYTDDGFDYDYSICGNNAEVGTEVCGDGLHLTGDNLKGTEVTANPLSDEPEKILVKGDSNEILLDNSWGELIPYQDLDGDGVFDDEVNYEIVPEGQDGSKEKYIVKTVKLSASTFTYNGKVQKPKVTVTDSRGQVLKEKTDYTLTYKTGCKNVGSHFVVVKFIGKYAGNTSQTRSFNILPKGTSLSKVKAKKKAITVKWKKQAVQTIGYQIQYSTSSNFKKNTKTVTVNKTETVSKKIKKLKAKKKYYVRIRTYKTVGGKKYYSNWSTAKKVKTK